jgi:predicted metal-dependent phosphotriesterase family hydrolase
MSRTLKQLARRYEVANFYDYVVESAVNGNWEQVGQLIREMRRIDRATLLKVVCFCGYYNWFDHLAKNKLIDCLIDALK